MKPTAREQFLFNLANLFKVKSIVTLALIFTFCFLTMREIQISNDFSMILTAVATYFFTKIESKIETWVKGDGQEAKNADNTKKKPEPPGGATGT